MVPHVMVDNRLRKAFGENERLFELETETNVDKTMDIAYAESVSSSLCHRAKANHGRYGKACH